MGFRSLDEVMEASDNELLNIDGIAPEDLPRLREQALRGTEDARRERIREVSERAEPLTEREKLTLVRGVSDRTADFLEQGGYGSIGSIEREADADRLAIKAGLAVERGREIKAAIAEFMQNEWPAIESGIRDAQTRMRAAEAKVRASEAEARARAEEEARGPREGEAGPAAPGGAGETPAAAGSAEEVPDVGPPVAPEERS